MSRYDARVCDVISRASADARMLLQDAMVPLRCFTPVIAMVTSPLRRYARAERRATMSVARAKERDGRYDVE